VITEIIFFFVKKSWLGVPLVVYFLSENVRTSFPLMQLYADWVYVYVCVCPLYAIEPDARSESSWIEIQIQI
jgi:hypothetical protein